MSTVNLGLSRLTIPDKIQKCRGVVSETTGNINFVTPNPSLATITTAVDSLETAYEAAQDGGKAKKAFMRTQDKAVNAFMKQFGGYVQDVSAGDETIILSSGLEVKRPKTQPQPLSAVVNVRVLTGTMTGNILGRWKRLAGSVLYNVQTSADGNTNWTDAGSCTKTSIIIGGFTSGSKVWVRVSGNNAKGQGPWSSPAQGMAG
jgi:hypothetical protein